MSSRIRYFGEVQGNHYSGWRLKQMLEPYFGKPVKSFAQVRAAAFAARAAGVRVNLWIFRERRELHIKRSRYKKLCKYFSTSCKAGTKKLNLQQLINDGEMPTWTAPPLQVAFQQGVTHAGINQPQGSPSQHQGGGPYVTPHH